ncbi:MAG: hypothetical protein J0H15_08145 [Xanthomonadales bacterium]|nr:hypothetical protein [Xanthomonadales bacterium]
MMRSPHALARRGRPALLVILVLLWAAGTLRAGLLWSHDPLYAYANSYDQTRYTSCFHFHPDRPAGVAPQQNSPQAPFAQFRFITSDDPMCYWSSELAFTGATAAVWKLSAALGAGPSHSVRWTGALRWLALLALSIAVSMAWLRRGDAPAALANAALLPVLFADPANTLYLNTFYAEWSALLAAYALLALTLLWREDPAGRTRFLLLALAALALATAKIQHLLLPLAVAGVVALVEFGGTRRIGWRPWAIGAGALLGLAAQIVQLGRDGAMMDAIDQYNRADVVFTALLPFADDPAALLAELRIDPACAPYSGKHAWEFPDLPEKVCAGLSDFTRGTELATLVRHPGLALRLAAASVAALDPWIAKNLGTIEGEDFAPLPASQPSLGRVLHMWPWLRAACLAAPWLGAFVLLLVPSRRRGRLLESSLLAASVMLVTLAVTVLGDGLADTAKQGHLVTNAALAWLFAGTAMLAARAFPTTR